MDLVTTYRKNMDFQNVNPTNVMLNLISGNLLPMTGNDVSFPIFWIIYSVLVWLLEIVQVIVLTIGCIKVSKEKALKDGLIGLAVTVEVIFFLIQIAMRKDLMLQLIRELDNMLHLKDELMETIIVTILKPIDVTLKVSWLLGEMAIVSWTIAPFLLLFQKNKFFYEDYRMPIVFSKEPFSPSIFVLGSLVVMVSSAYIFTKKVSMDSYIINVILLTTAQYRYVAIKLAIIFHNNVPQDTRISINKKNQFSNFDYCAEKEIKILCRHYNILSKVSLILKKLLSVSFSIIYVNNVLRFCCICIMLLSIPSGTWLERFVSIMYALSGILQLYVLCSCVQQLLNASVEVTDQAFHEEWYRYGTSIKRTFVFLLMFNNIGLKLSKFERCNLSRSSFMAILNQSYSIALLLFNTN